MELLAEQFPELDLATALLAAGVCFVAALLGAFSGFGSGLIITLFITPVIGPKAVIPVISVMMLINNATRVWFFRDHLEAARILPIAATAVPAAALGALLYVRLDADAVQGLLGAILIACVPLRRWLAGREVVPNRTTIVTISGTYGFLSSIIVGAGMLVIPILMGFGLAGPALLATDAAIAVLVNAAKIAFFGTLDALPLHLFLLAIAMGLCTIPGTWTGAWIVRRTAVHVHTILIEALIVGGGAAMLFGALFGD